MRYVYLFLAICSLKQLVSAQQKTHIYEKMKDRRFQHAFASAISPSAIACCETCPRTGQCVLVSYNKQTRECEMSGLLPGEESYIQSELGWDLYFDTENECTSNPCQNSGICQDEIGYYTCTCTTGWSGQNCETEICPVGWEQFESSCYYIETSPLSWTDAKANCGSHGGHLMNIKTEGENNFFINLFNGKHSGSAQQIWIGGTNYGSGNIFYWTDDTVVGSVFQYWFSGQPDNWGGNEECLLLRSYQEFRWNDGVCSNTFWSVCQK